MTILLTQVRTASAETRLEDLEDAASTEPQFCSPKLVSVPDVQRSTQNWAFMSLHAKLVAQSQRLRTPGIVDLQQHLLRKCLLSSWLESDLYINPNYQCYLNTSETLGHPSLPRSLDQTRCYAVICLDLSKKSMHGCTAHFFSIARFNECTFGVRFFCTTAQPMCLDLFAHRAARTRSSSTLVTLLRVATRNHPKLSKSHGL